MILRFAFYSRQVPNEMTPCLCTPFLLQDVSIVTSLQEIHGRVN